jgi:hypothetical protein
MGFGFGNASGSDSLLWTHPGCSRTCTHKFAMSALPPKADIRQGNRDVRFVPKADIDTELSFGNVRR